MKSLALLLAVSVPFSAFPAQQIMRQAMQPPAQQPVQQSPPPAPQPRFVLEDGTPVKLVLNETISSANQHKGNLVIFAVAEDVKIGDVIVIPKGANAWATITIARPKGKIGRAGKIELSVDKVRLADGEKVVLSDIEGGDGDSGVHALSQQRSVHLECDSGHRTDGHDDKVTVTDDLEVAPPETTLQLRVRLGFLCETQIHRLGSCVMVSERPVNLGVICGNDDADTGLDAHQGDVLERVMREPR